MCIVPDRLFARHTKHIRTYQPPNQISKQLCSMYNIYIVMTFSVRLIEVKPDQTEEKIASGVFGPDPHRDTTRPSKLLRNKKIQKSVRERN